MDKKAYVCVCFIFKIGNARSTRIYFPISAYVLKWEISHYNLDYPFNLCRGKSDAIKSWLIDFFDFYWKINNCESQWQKKLLRRNGMQKIKIKIKTKISGAGSASEERYFGMKKQFAPFNHYFVCDTATGSLCNLKGVILHQK